MAMESVVPATQALATYPDLQCLTVPDVARLLAIGPTKAYEMLQANALPHLHLGHRVVVRVVDLRAYMAAAVEPVEAG